MGSSRKWIWAASFAGFAIAMFPTSLFASTEVKFGDADLLAFVQLVKPEQISLRLDGRSGDFNPGPALEYTGLEHLTFDIDLNVGANLVDLRFNDLRAKTPTVTFEADRVRLDIGFADQSKAIRSALGSISLKGVKLTAWARLATDGSGRLTYDAGSISGELKGSGLLKPKWVIDAIKSLALKTLKSETERQLGQASVQESIAKGLVMWAQFSTDSRLSHVTPGTVKVSADGLRFQAE